MDRLIPALVVVAFLTGWNWLLYKKSRGRAWSPLWMAFSTTATAILFVVSGALGYTLNKHTRFVNGTAWSDSVIWWEIWTGIAVALVAACFWRAGLRSIRTSN